MYDKVLIELTGLLLCKTSLFALFLSNLGNLHADIVLELLMQVGTISELEQQFQVHEERGKYKGWKDG